MSHNTLISELEHWLIGETLGDPEIVGVFDTLCQRLHAVGIPVERAALSWPTLHPLFRAEQVFWWLGRKAVLEQRYHASANARACPCLGKSGCNGGATRSRESTGGHHVIMPSLRRSPTPSGAASCRGRDSTD